MARLLVSDDNAIVHHMIALTFVPENVAVTAVRDGDDAIARIVQDLPDVVLASTSTSRRSGYDVAEFVQSRPELRHIPVVLLAGAFERVDEARANRAGCAGILIKPFEPQQLVAVVKECLARPVPAAPPRLAAPPEWSFTRAPERRGPATPDVEELDDYFEELDAAFTRRTGAPPPAVMRRGPDAARDAAARDDAARDDAAPGEPEGDAEPAFASEVETVPPGPGLPEPVPTLDQVLGGDPTPAAPAPASPPAPAPATPPAPDLVDEVTRRVIERLGEDAVRGVVADVVAEVAERLIREEIARIRSKR